MKNKAYILNITLTILVAAGLVAAILVRTFAPHIILPKMSIPAVSLISLAALLLDYLITKGEKRSCVLNAVFSALTFGVLPFVAGFITPLGILIYGIGGAAVFTVTAWLFSLTVDRLSSGPAAKFAPYISAFALYIASQCFSNIIL